MVRLGWESPLCSCWAMEEAAHEFHQDKMQGELHPSRRYSLPKNLHPLVMQTYMLAQFGPSNGILDVHQCIILL